MPGDILTVNSTIQCPHGGSAILSTTNSKASLVGGFALLESDIHSVAGCPFMIGTTPSPCIRIEWSAGAGKVSVGGTKVLVQSSSGTCYSPANAPQGMAIVANTQAKGSAQ